VEGAVIAWTAVDTFKLHEVTHNHFQAPISNATAYVIMSKRSFDRLSPQAKAAIERFSGEPFTRTLSEVVQRQDDAAQERVHKLPGHAFETITPDERARWVKQLERIAADWSKTTPNGAAILSGFREEVKKARAETTK
jgi:TRAP-type C4-dicarboxylate transport system substrate-binding protein